MPLQVEGDSRQHEQSHGIRSRYVPCPGAAALPAGPACCGKCGRVHSDSEICVS